MSRAGSERMTEGNDLLRSSLRLDVLPHPVKARARLAPEGAITSGEAPIIRSTSGAKMTPTVLITTVTSIDMISDCNYTNDANCLPVS